MLGWSGNDCLYSPGRWNQNVAHRSPPDGRIVVGERHAVESDDFERSRIHFQIRIQIRTRVYDPPKLALAGRDVDLRPQSSVDGESGLWLFGCGAALRGLHRDRLHHGSSLSGIVRQNKISQHQDPLTHVPYFWRVTLDPFNHDSS